MTGIFQTKLSHLHNSAREQIELPGADAVASLRQLKTEGEPDLLIPGSTDFLQTSLTHDLVDEMQIMRFPIIPGNGKRLFGEGVSPAAFKFLRTQASDRGVIVSRYVRAVEVKTGSFAAEQPSAEELKRREHLS